MKDVKSTNFNPLVLPADLSPDKVFEFNELVQTAISAGVHELKIDCSQIENAASTHIGILWKAYDACKSAGVKMTLEEATTSLMRVLYILDLGDLFGLGSNAKIFARSGKVRSIDSSKSHEYTKLIDVSKESLKTSLDPILKFFRKRRVPEVTEFELRTVYYEVITNIIDHSGLTEHDNIKFTATINGNSVTLVFEDLGSEFDPTKYKGSGDLAELVAAAKDRRFKGFGLLMIRKLVDNIKYTRKENIINCLEIEKHWS